ncbi:hypothetical protein [Thiocystis violacea]|uniref:hypothetical protein n=1 Tax=Thiocystis violacea TaxID=13725 RepID=UPI0019059FFA|nr:hypothetical protein [Thiocystis violacea]MBK1721840.1 hypothetical protein [Thiocystis violacea]
MCPIHVAPKVGAIPYRQCSPSPQARCAWLKAIAAWAQDLSQAARARFGCRYRHGRYEVPSRTRIRDVLMRDGDGCDQK